MSSTLKFSQGDYLIDSDGIYQVTKIDESRLHYRPIDSQHGSVTGSIPITNIQSSGFRHLQTPKEFKDFLTKLSQSSLPEVPIDSKYFKEISFLNNPFESIPLLLQLWNQKNNPNVNFSGSNRDTLELIINHLCQEFSLSTHQSPEIIRKKIINELGKK